MLRVVTVADERFLRPATRLRNSLMSSGNEFRLTIFCDRRGPFGPLEGGRCEVRELPRMRRVGAKRAKLEAFHEASREGGFLYLDADAIVLERLDEMCRGDRIAGCADDLSHCPYIPDPRYPWPGSPGLRNEVYINSGVFHAPAARRGFFEELHRRGLDDRTWEKYTHTDKLLDNHFFCAHLNLLGEPVRQLDPRAFGWQGFLYERGLRVERRGGRLVGRHTGEALRIVIFAGYEQTFELLFSLPIEVASLLFERTGGPAGTPDDVLSGCLSALSPQLARLQDAHAAVVARRILAEFRHLLVPGIDRDWRASPSYLADPEAMRALACASPDPMCEWNGLRCGGAYLDGDEYNAIREMVRALGIGTVVETGAGESSAFFKELGLRAASIESRPGPWLDRAAALGCTVLRVPFDEGRARYSEDDLRPQLEAGGTVAADLLFIDSPTGTARRRNLASQLLRLLDVRFVLYHDAIRDAGVIFRDQAELGLQLVSFIPTRRGLALFSTGPAGRLGVPASRRLDAPLGSPRVRVERLGGEADPWPAGTAAAVRVRIVNEGAGVLASRGRFPIFISYHWMEQAGGCAAWDGRRTALPFDIHEGDEAVCVADVAAPGRGGMYELQVTLVQEGVQWLHRADPRCIARIPVEVAAGGAR